MFWKRMTAAAGWAGLVAGTLAAVVVAVLSNDALGVAGHGGVSVGVINLSGQGAAFVAAGAAFVVDVLVSVLVTSMSRPKPESDLRGLVFSLTPKEDLMGERVSHWWESPTRLAGISLVLVIILNVIFH
jgi:SSS family solute:Na+ symporter